MDQSGWSTMTVAEATILYWLKDLDTWKKNQVDLGDKAHKAWDVAELQGIPFTILHCIKIAHAHCKAEQNNPVLHCSW